MKKILLFNLLFIITFAVYGSSKTDSLKAILSNTEKQDTLYAHHLNEIAGDYTNTSLDSSFKYAQQGLSLSKKLNFINGIAESKRILSVYHFRQGDTDKSFNLIQRAEDLYRETGNREKLAVTLNTHGMILKNHGNRAEALLYYEQSLQLAQEFENKRFEFEVINNIANIYARQGKYDLALELYDRADSLANELNNQAFIASVYSNIALIYEYQDKFDRALEYNEKSLEIFNQLGDKEKIIGCYNNIGNIERKKANYLAALSHLTDAVELSKELNNIRLLSISLINKANVFLENEKPLKALLLYEEAAQAIKTVDKSTYASALANIGIIKSEEKEHHEALDILKEAVEIFIAENSPVNIAIVKNAIANVYFELEEEEKAIQTFTEVLELAAKNNLRHSSISSHFGLAKIYKNNRQLSLALSHAKKADEISKAIGVVLDEKRAVQLLYEIYKAKGNKTESLKYLEYYQELKDSLFSQEKSNKLAALEAEYQYKLEIESNKFEQEARMLEQETALLENRARNETLKIYLYILLISVLVLFGVIAMLYWIKKMRDKTNKELELQRRRIEHSNKELRELHQQKNKLFSIIAHDLRSPLNSLKRLLELTTQEQVSPEQTAELLPKIKEQVSKTVLLTDNLLKWGVKSIDNKKIKKKDVNVHQVSFDTYQLFADLFEEKGIAFENRVPEDFTIKVDEDILKLVLRNLLSNAVKFCSKEDSVIISAKMEAAYNKICVRDTGIGMQKEQKEKLFTEQTSVAVINHTDNKESGSGIGLMLCKSYILENGGEIWIEHSEVGEGTTICFRLPTH